MFFFSNYLLINFGPQHPSTHGVLRLLLQLNGELIQNCDATIGFLHRGTESLVEFKNFNNSSIYFDRLDYTSVLNQTYVFCLVIENYLNFKKIYYWIKYIRMVFSELSRILNHLLVLATHSLDVGNMIPMFWAFEEREFIMYFFEKINGARMHANFFKPFFYNLTNFNKHFFYNLLNFCLFCNKTIIEFYLILINNKIWLKRLKYVGQFSKNNLNKYIISGPICRSCGKLFDLRLIVNITYDLYYLLFFNSFFNINGDCLDRFNIRIFELLESLIIIIQILSFFFLYKFLIIKFFNNFNIKFSNWFNLNNKILFNLNYKYIESGKGSFGVLCYLKLLNIIKCKIHSPAFYHLILLIKQIINSFIADIITIIGSFDLVFGEIDK